MTSDLRLFFADRLCSCGKLWAEGLLPSTRALQLEGGLVRQFYIFITSIALLDALTHGVGSSFRLYNASRRGEESGVLQQSWPTTTARHPKDQTYRTLRTIFTVSAAFGSDINVITMIVVRHRFSTNGPHILLTVAFLPLSRLIPAKNSD